MEHAVDKEKYERLKEYLAGHDDLECYPSESELEDIFNIVMDAEKWSENIGHRAERIEHNPIEASFYETWLKWNRPQPGYGNGHGILQDLFIDSGLNMWDRKLIAEISGRERWIVATIIQWLGTNVGMSFLHEVFSKVDMYIAKRGERG